MLNFSFQNPTKILFGSGRIKDISKEISKDSKIMITYGGGSIKRNGVMDEVKEGLQGYDLAEFGGIEPNPVYETLLKGVEKVQNEKIDFLLAVGGGSVIDGTKFIAAAAYYAGDPWDIVKTYGKVIGRTLPFGTVITLPASGSEMNCLAVISRLAGHDKLTFRNPKLFPRFSVLDPTKTYTLPANQVSNGVADTFVHIIEQYITYPVAGKIQDRFAEGLLLTLIEDGPKALIEPQNYEVRSNLMWCASLGLNGLIAAGVPEDWATHVVGHELTALHGLDHGVTLAIVLPAMLKIRKDDKKQKLLQYADRIWGISEGDEDTRIDSAIEKTREFFESMQIKTHLCDYGITAETIPVVAERLKEHKLVKLGEKFDVTPEIVERMLQLCL